MGTTKRLIAVALLASVSACSAAKEPPQPNPALVRELARLNALLDEYRAFAEGCARGLVQEKDGREFRCVIIPKDQFNEKET